MERVAQRQAEFPAAIQTGLSPERVLGRLSWLFVQTARDEARKFPVFVIRGLLPGSAGSSSLCRE
jgi:hypothetical protein